MSEKAVVIGEDVLILLNRVRAKMLNSNPKVKKLTDEGVIRTALIKYLG